MNGCFYSFFVDAAGELVVREIDPNDVVLELLDGTSGGVKTWGDDLPIRLQRMHSHWWCRGSHAIVLRPKLFNERGTDFILVPPQFDLWSRLVPHRTPPSSSPTSTWKCLRVPHHTTGWHWTDLHQNVDSFDELRIPTDPNCPSLLVLQKFERLPGVVHTLLSPSGTLIFELPRYDLRFELAGDGNLLSADFVSFSLARHQLLHDTLHGFQQYLVLESSDCRKVLMPAGKIVIEGDNVVIQGSPDCGRHQLWHSFDVHGRLHTLEVPAGPRTIEAIRQLAGLHAATGSEVPESRYRMTGGEFAMELLRKSRVNRPSRAEEHDHLSSIVESYSQLNPALSLLCSELDISSRELAFLHKKKRSELQSELSRDTDAENEYRQRKRAQHLNTRMALLPDEELRVLGLKVTAASKGRVPPRVGSLEVPVVNELCKCTCAIVPTVEDQLRCMIQTSPAEKENSPQIVPIREQMFQDTEIGRSLMSELLTAWDSFVLSSSVQVVVSLPNVKAELPGMRIQVAEARKELEAQLLLSLTLVPEGTCWQEQGFNMRRAANLEPYATSRDLIRAALERDELRRFNMFLSDTAVKDLHNAILEWLKLCVLEDKLDRMACALLQTSGGSEDLTRELQNLGRSWSVEEHPEWLVFEVEQRLQIRHVQYVIAQFLMDNPGTTTQLNMGEGKTRIIIPMLLLSLAGPDRLTRLHFLSPLLGEAYDYLHCVITASLICRPMWLIPFDRDVNMSLDDVKTLRYSLLRCMSALGGLCIAPEHRLSLKLKSQELWEAHQEAYQPIQTELALIEALPWYDIIDECDEMLRQKYQLIYALGKQISLPQAKERWVAIQAVLKVLQTHPGVANLLKEPNVAQRLVREAHGAGSFDDLRLLTGAALEAQAYALLKLLAQGVIEDPPYHMSWLKCVHGNEALRTVIIAFVTDPTQSIDLLTGNDEWLKLEAELAGTQGVAELERSQLYALRGLLAFDIMKHCLCRRHRVDYGIDSRRAMEGQLRVAVPFHASDTPKERAEYAHPDTLIVLTHLAYYHGGISPSNIKEALLKLLSLGGENAVTYEYNLWLLSAWPTMTDKQRGTLDLVDKCVRKSSPRHPLPRKFTHPHCSYLLVGWIPIAVCSSSSCTRHSPTTWPSLTFGWAIVCCREKQCSSNIALAQTLLILLRML